jgi:23S rRNA (guanosine2251-2'-O)-methyltransferase
MATVKKQKKVMGEFIYGLNPVIEALKAKRRKFIAIYTTKETPKGFARIEKLLPKYPVTMQYVTREVLTKMAETSDHQGVIAWVQEYPFRKKPFDPAQHKTIVMLDGIQDPRNLGAILRSAYCTGVDGVVMCKKNGAPLNAVAIKSAAGLSEHLEIYQAPSAIAAVQELKAAGYHLYLAVFDGTDAMKCTFERPACIVIGSEGFGVSKEIMNSGTKVTLPQRNNDISYNASVAAGILLFLAQYSSK